MACSGLVQHLLADQSHHVDRHGLTGDVAGRRNQASETTVLQAFRGSSAIVRSGCGIHIRAAWATGQVREDDAIRVIASFDDGSTLGRIDERLVVSRAYARAPVARRAFNRTRTRRSRRP